MPEQELSDLRQLLSPRLTPYIPHAPEPPQTAFLLLGCEEAFYGGAAGGGKSDALLMAALQYTDVPGYDALIVRRTYAELSKPGAIMARSLEWLKGSDATWNEQKKTWRFPSGASLSFGYLRREQDVYQYQGAEYDFIGFDELTQFTEWQYTYLFSRLRQLKDAPFPKRMRSASNPGGIGHGWVKKRFISEPAAGTVFIPARLVDNPHLDRDGYVASLQHLPETTRAQLLDGDWGAFEGMAYPMLDRSLHVVDPFEIPGSFQRFESMDHGVTNPTAWLLFTVDYDGNLIVADEYYKPGLPDEHAREILDRRKTLWEAKDENGWTVRHSAFGDPASLREALPLKNDYGQPLTLQDEYERHGIHLIPANNRRKTGFVRVAELLKPDPARRFPMWHQRAGEMGAPSLFLVGQRCPNLLEQIEAAPLASEEADPERGEAVDRRWESAHGHSHAALRYGCLTRERASALPEVVLDPRAELLRRIEKAHHTDRDDLIDV